MSGISAHRINFRNASSQLNNHWKRRAALVVELVLTRDKNDEITIRIDSSPFGGSGNPRYLASHRRVVITDDLHSRVGPAENQVLAGCLERDLFFGSLLLSSSRFLDDGFLDEFVFCSCDLERFGIADNLKHLDHTRIVELVETRFSFRDLRFPGSDDYAGTLLLLRSKSRLPGWRGLWRWSGRRFFLGWIRVLLLGQ